MGHTGPTGSMIHVEWSCVSAEGMSRRGMTEIWFSPQQGHRHSPPPFFSMKRIWLSLERWRVRYIHVGVLLGCTPPLLFAR